jgi:predicted permease
LRALVNRKGADRDIHDEVESYLDQAASELISQGRSPEEARRHVQLEFGNATLAREQVRSSGWENAVASFLSDVRYASRRLRGKPGFTAASVLTLALGLGATIAIFSLIDGVLLKPLPHSHSEELVMLRHTAPGIGIKDLNMSASLYFTYREESRVFQDVTLWSPETSDITGLAEPEEVPVLLATHRFLPMLQVQPALGRGFRPEDDDSHGERTVMLTDGYWKARFGGDPSVLGRRLMVDGLPREIIGVLPPAFQFMDRRIALLLPLRLNRSEVRLISFCCQGTARLKPGVTLAQANADVARMLPMAPAKFAVNAGFGGRAFLDARIAPNLLPLKDALVGDVGRTLWVLMGTVGIVLLIACANVANLLLVRTDARSPELAVRAALGAGWGRIARELLLESVLLGTAGGALGLAFAYGGLRVLAASEAAHLPRLQDVSIGPLVILFAVGISLLSGLLFGLIPIFKYVRPQLADTVRTGGRTLSQSRERHRTRAVLVAAQMGLAVVLLAASGLMIRTFQALRQVDPGFTRAQEVQSLSVFIPEAQIKDPERAIRMEEELLRRFESMPGVSAVGMVSALPMEGGSNNPVYMENQPLPDGGVPPIRRFKFISPGYVSAIGAQLVAGRDVTWAETYRQAPVVLISENMAREVWHDPRAAIGKRIRSTLKDDWREVVGVIGDLRDDGVDQKAPGIVYFPLFLKNYGGSDTRAIRGVAFLVRSNRTASAGLLQELQRTLTGVNPNLPMANVKTLQSVYDRSLARASFAMTLLAIAGSMALLLGMIGLYGVISYSVSQRTREIGIRLALGAPLNGLTGMFVRHGLLLSGIGAICGLAVALAGTRLMKSMLYQVSPADPLTYVLALGGLVLAAALASYLPARRATRVDPVEALRAE